MFVQEIRPQWEVMGSLWRTSKYADEDLSQLVPLVTYTTNSKTV